MKKKLLPLAIAAIMAPGFAAAADTSGFVDVTYMITDDQVAAGPSSTEGKFSANGEIDFSASPADGVTVRMDVDVSAAMNSTPSSVELEQAFFAWSATEGVTVLGGIFNNPVGMECGDAPCMWGTQGGVVGNILNNQTALAGNNVAGLAVAGAVGPATVTFGLLNEAAQTNEENSIALVVNASPVEGLDVELGLVTLADNSTRATAGGATGVGVTGTESAGDVMDLNISYAIPGVEGLSVALDYLTADDYVDSAYELMVNYSNGPWGAGVRLETVSYGGTALAGANVDDSERTTFHASYQVASNLVAILEVADGDHGSNNHAAQALSGIEKDGLTTLELIATF